MSVKQQKDLLLKLVARLETGAPYADALYIENAARRLVKDVTELESTAEADAGVKLRAFDGQKFHERCIQGWNPALMQRESNALLNILRNQKITGKTLTLKPGKGRVDKEYEVTPVRDPASVSMEQKTAFVTGLHERVMKHSPAFVNCQIGYREEEERRVFVSRQKQLSSLWTGCTVVIVPFVQTSDGQTRSDFTSFFANGYEATELDETVLSNFLDRAVKIKTARRITPGKYTAVLAPSVTGLLAHESFGHGMEADTIAHGRARAADYLGKKIASVKVNICEDASLPSTHGFLFFDDEGCQPEKVYLVERGIVKHPITDLYSVSQRNFVRTANGRAESFDHKIYARMTNTFFERGKDNPERMIKDVKDGMYVHSGSSGMEDPKGWGVQIGGLLCERIKRGKRTGELFYEASIGGYLPDILGNIKAIGSDFEIIKDVGFCGKNHKEWVRVSSGGPHLLIQELQLS